MNSPLARLSLILWFLTAPALAQSPEWFVPSRKTETVEMLRELFRRPVNDWASVLRSRPELLDDEFFESLDKRVRWGLANDHFDDAIRFQLLRDMARIATGRKKSLVVISRPVAKTFEMLLTGKETSPGDVDLLTLEAWLEILRSKSPLIFNSRFFTRIERDIRNAVNSKYNEEAMLLALIADTALALRGERGDYRWRVLDTLSAGYRTSIPLDIDPTKTARPLRRQNTVEMFHWNPVGPP
jgi:hypothetical protein